jgi:Domain of unknown function (DUF4326)
MEAPQVLPDHYLKTQRLPTFLRGYDKVAQLCAAECVDYAPGGKVVREGTIYGNDVKPLERHSHPIAQTEEEFRLYAENKMFDDTFRTKVIKDLRGKHLLCWCIQDGPERAPFCHARVWLDIVNRPEYGEK